MFTHLHTNVEYYQRLQREVSDSELQIFLQALRIYQRQTAEVWRYFQALRFAADKQVKYQRQMKNAMKNLHIFWFRLNMNFTSYILWNIN